MDFKHCCPNPACDCYKRGLADARRTVEAEVAADRAVLAMLASSLAEAADDFCLLIHPCDAAQFDDVAALPIQVDPNMIPGNVRVGRRGDVAAHRLS